MSNVQFYERRVLVSGATLPILELVVTEGDEQTVVPLTGYAVYLTFWYRGEDVHYENAGYIYNGAQGIARYEFDGNESPTPGDLLYQWNLQNMGTLQQSVQEWCEYSTPIFVRRIVTAQP